MGWISFSTGGGGGAGTPGADGATIITGAGAPSAETGKDSDLYLNTTNFDLYQKADGAWGDPIGRVKGDDGVTPVKGVDYDDGAPGASVYAYRAYASDDSGTDFSTSPGAGLDYMAIKFATEEIASPQASDFAGLWFKHVGTDGSNGTALTYDADLGAFVVEV